MRVESGLSISQTMRRNIIFEETLETTNRVDVDVFDVLVSIQRVQFVDFLVRQLRGVLASVVSPVGQGDWSDLGLQIGVVAQNGDRSVDPQIDVAHSSEHGGSEALRLFWVGPEQMAVSVQSVNTILLLSADAGLNNDKYRLATL